MRTVAVPAEISVRDAFVIQELQSTKQAVVFRYLNSLTAQLDFNQPVEGLKDIQINFEFLLLHMSIIGTDGAKVYLCNY